MLQLSPEEAASLAQQANGLPGTVLGEGATPVIIGGVKYMVLRADDNVFYVRQVLPDDAEHDLSARKPCEPVEDFLSNRSLTPARGCRVRRALALPRPISAFLWACTVSSARTSTNTSRRR